MRNTPPPKILEGNQRLGRHLNHLSDYAKAHGVNAKGVVGWTESPEGWVPPVQRPGGSEAETKPCCGVSALVGSNEIRSLFERQDDGTYFETSGGNYAGYNIYDIGGGKFGLGTSPASIEWEGAVPGLEGVPFNYVGGGSGLPDPIFFYYMPSRVYAVNSDGTERELTHPIAGDVGQGGFEYVKDGWRLFWDPFASNPGPDQGAWQFDSNTGSFFAERNVLSFSGQYGDTYDPETSTNFATILGDGSAGSPGGVSNSVQWRGSDSGGNGGRALQGSSGLVIKEL